MLPRPWRRALLVALLGIGLFAGFGVLANRERAVRIVVPEGVDLALEYEGERLAPPVDLILPLERHVRRETGSPRGLSILERARGWARRVARPGRVDAALATDESGVVGIGFLYELPDESMAEGLVPLRLQRGAEAHDLELHVESDLDARGLTTLRITLR